jgi:DNA-binding transcriptional LysR family regulator
MADRQADWEWYRSFLAVMEAGSVTAAARAMGLAQPTVGRHIDNLEQALRLKLFTRASDGFTPTEAGHALAPYAAEMASTAQALLRAASGQGDGVRGSVRISASDVVGVEVLPPILARLRERYPALVIELVLSNQADDLLHRQADIAVRMFQPAQEALVARHVGAIELGLFGHPDYLQAHGTPATLDQLASHTLIGYDRETPFLRAQQAKYPQFTREQFALRADSDVAQLAFIRAGFGLGVCQTGLASRAPALTRVLAADLSLRLDTWIVMHEDLRNSPRCAVTFAALAEGLAAYAAA